MPICRNVGLQGKSKTDRLVLLGVLLLLGLSVVLAVVSFLPSAEPGSQSELIIDSTFRLTPQETYRQGLGSFRGDENITLRFATAADCPISFTLLTYGGPRYANASASEMTYIFPAGADYYEAVFLANATTNTNVHFQVSVEKPNVAYPFSWLGTFAKALFFLSWAALMLVLLVPILKNRFETATEKRSPLLVLKKKNVRRLQIAVLVSLLFWIGLLAVNTYPLATFENWYTDSARHPYTSAFFLKDGFSVFDTSLGALSGTDSSLYKYVTWSEMPHLYPLGSILLFLPFGVLLEGGVAQTLVFKLEIALMLVVSHVCLYFFLKRFWTQELTLSLKQLLTKPFRKQQGSSFVLKALGTYLFYIILVIYAANGQFDSVAFLFALPAMFMFLRERYDWFLLLGAASLTVKYQAGIFLIPLVLVSLIRLAQQPKPLTIFRNKVVLAAIALTGVDFLTAYLSAPFLMSARPEFVMNVANAFSPHAQLPWSVQAFAVAATLVVTLTCAVYLLNRNRLMSLFAVFTLLPAFTMPYFQVWYLPFFFVYPLIPQSKRSMEVTMGWLIFMVLVLSFGGLAFNPLTILDNIRRVLGFG
ncbi:MAG: hypothetical protein NWF05_09220 [Candidatus Bathyarchaeota archaeon]|nr:hypothetical protein [Candidatus Bathyarchaeota archaeon]